MLCWAVLIISDHLCYTLKTIHVLCSLNCNYAVHHQQLMLILWETLPWIFCSYKESCAHHTTQLPVVMTKQANTRRLVLIWWFRNCSSCIVCWKDYYDAMHLGSVTLQPETKKTTHTNLFNGLSLGSLFLFLTFFLSPSISGGCSFHCQEVKSHPFVSLQGEERQWRVKREKYTMVWDVQPLNRQLNT